MALSDGEMKRILLVDDDASVRKVLRCCLEAHHYHCLEAEDGVAALACFKQEQPIDLVITDNHMPNMTGIELLETLREKFPSNRLPIILHTGNITDALQEQALHAGAYAVLGKPSDIREIMSTVERVFGN